MFRVDFKDINTKYDCMSNSLKIDQESNIKKVNESIEAITRQLDNVRYLNTQNHSEIRKNYISIEQFESKMRELFKGQENILSKVAVNIMET